VALAEARPAQTLLTRLESLDSRRVPEIVLPRGWQPWPECLGRLHQAGYLPGWPPHVHTHTARIDDGCHRSIECDRCGSEGPHGIHPYQRGPSLRVLVRCINCNSAREV